MSFSDLTAGIDDSTREHLCDTVQLFPVAGGDALLLPAMIDEPVEPTGMGLGAPMLQAEIQIFTADHAVRVGDIVVTGRLVDAVFVPASPARSWRVAGAATKDASGRWQTAAIERWTAQ